MVITQTESEVSIFRSPKGYVMIREIHLAFGNRAKEIHYVQEIQYATKFPIFIKQLDKKDYYHKFPSVLEEELKIIERNVVKVSTTYEVMPGDITYV